MELSADQRLYLQTIFDYFHEHGKWPTYGYLDRKLTQIRRDLDIEEISKSLPSGWASAFAFNHDINADAVLSISAISICKSSEEDLANFIRALIFCVERYFSAEEDTIEISSHILAQHLNMSEVSIRKVGLLLRDANEYPIYQVFGSRDTEYKNWSCTLSRNIRYFDGITSIEKYLEKIDHLKKTSPNIIKPQDNSKENNKDKGSTSVMMKAFSFQSLIHDLLKNLGYRVVPEQRIGDAQVDLLAYYPITSPIGITGEQVWIVETKYRNLTGKIGIDILYRLVALTQEIEGSNALLVLNSTLTKAAAMYASKRSELEVWDISKLLSLLEQFPELKQKYSEIVPEVKSVIDEKELIDNKLDSQHELIRELRNLPTGDGNTHEELVKRILEFCFHDEFKPFAVKEQVDTEDKKKRRDFIIDSRSPKVEFWQSLKWTRKVEKILFDAKNYKNPLEYREISDTLRYLENDAFGNFIIIICRLGVKDYKEALDSYLKSGRITLFLDDDDLVKMINLKIEGESPTLLIEDRYYDFLDKK